MCKSILFPLLLLLRPHTPYIHYPLLHLKARTHAHTFIFFFLLSSFLTRKKLLKSIFPRGQLLKDSWRKRQEKAGSRKKEEKLNNNSISTCVCLGGVCSGPALQQQSLIIINRAKDAIEEREAELETGREATKVADARLDSKHVKRKNTGEIPVFLHLC